MNHISVGNGNDISRFFNMVNQSMPLSQEDSDRFIFYDFMLLKDIKRQPFRHFLKASYKHVFFIKEYYPPKIGCICYSIQSTPLLSFSNLKEVPVN